MTEGRKQPIAALALSLVPGLGHIYSGEVGTGVAWLIGTWFAYGRNPTVGLIVHIFCAASAVNAAGRANSMENRELSDRRESAEDVARMLDRAARDRAPHPSPAGPQHDPPPRALRAAFPVPPAALMAALQSASVSLGMRTIAADSGKGILLLEDRVDGGVRVPIEARIEPTPAGSRVRMVVDRPPGAREDPAADDARLREIVVLVERFIAGDASTAPPPPKPVPPVSPTPLAGTPAPALSVDAFLDGLADAWDDYEEGRIDQATWNRRRDNLLHNAAGGDSNRRGQLHSACRPLVDAGILTPEDLRTLDRTP